MEWERVRETMKEELEDTGTDASPITENTTSGVATTAVNVDN